MLTPAGHKIYFISFTEISPPYIKEKVCLLSWLFLIHENISQYPWLALENIPGPFSSARLRDLTTKFKNKSAPTAIATRLIS